MPGLVSKQDRFAIHELHKHIDTFYHALQQDIVSLHFVQYCLVGREYQADMTDYERPYVPANTLSTEYPVSVPSAVFDLILNTVGSLSTVIRLSSYGQFTAGSNARQTFQTCGQIRSACRLCSGSCYCSFWS